MGRKRIIEDRELLALIDDYFIVECEGHSSLVSLPAIAKYVANWYPEYTVTTLRRNQVARDYIKKLCEDSEAHKLSVLATYKTLDIPRFMEGHASRASLAKALAELDSYYKTIAENAMEFTKQYKTAANEIERLTNELAKRKAHIARLESEKREVEAKRIQQKEMLITYKRQIEEYRDIIETYFYPDIANNLLKQDGDLSQVATKVDPEKVDGSVLAADDVVANTGSKVIRGLFSQFKGDADG